jgi:hypothetical protein
MNPAYISALSALFGSAIGAFASLATTWLTQRHQDEVRQRAQVNIRRERVFVEFIDLSSKAFVDACSEPQSRTLRRSCRFTRQWGSYVYLRPIER